MDRGETFQDRYEIESYRASTDTVELFDAVDRQLVRPVTLQIVHEALAADTDIANAFVAHQKFGLSLYHCSIMAIYDVGVEEGRSFSVMERLRPLVPADFRLRDGSPDLPVVLKIVRQVAEAVDCCRVAGLVDWEFAPEGVGLDDEGNARLAIIEGSSRAADDVSGIADAAALGKLLIGLLASGEAFDLSVLPSSVVILVDRIERRAGSPFSSAGELAGAIGAIEQAGSDPTQTYVPEAQIPVASPVASVVSAVPVADAGNKATEALTIMPPDNPDLEVHMGQSYSTLVPRKNSGTQRPVLIALSGLVAAILLLFVVLPRLVDGRGELATQGLITPTSTAVPLVAAPDLKGMTLEDAQVLADGYRLTIALGEASEDKAQPLDTVLNQEPPVGTLVRSGSVITVSLNLVTQAQPLPSPVSAQEIQPAAQPPAPQATGAEHGKVDNENKGKGKSKGKDK